MDKASSSGQLMRTHIDVPIATTRVANIYDYIVGRHGNSISGLQLYKEKKMEENELKVVYDHGPMKYKPHESHRCSHAWPLTLPRSEL